LELENNGGLMMDELDAVCMIAASVATIHEIETEDIDYSGPENEVKMKIEGKQYRITVEQI